ncbi:MAG: aryl-alcohol dehydrogenase [Actinomycetota bacterium]|jgi:aryl-alcohol dehydrogenase
MARAAVLRSGHGPFTVEELTVGEPNEHEVLVRVVAAGMCHTDLLMRELPPEFFAGPQVYGHEGAGVVEEVGSAVTSVQSGDHVVLSFTSCHHCPACALNRRAYCFNFQLHNMSGGRVDGTSVFTDANGERVGSHFFGQSSFSELTVVAEDSVVKVDPSLDLAKVGPLGCGIQTGAGTILNTLRVEPGATVVIAGAGALGLSAVMAAQVAEAGAVIAIDRYANRLDLAKRFGATEVISAAPSELALAIREASGGGARYAFDTTGNAEVVRGLYEGLDNIGTLAMAGVGFGDVTFDFLSMIGGRRIVGVMEGDSVPSEFIPRLAALNAEGRFPFDELITTFPIEQVNEAEAASADGSVIKPVLIFD